MAMKYWREVAVVVALILAGLCFKAWLENHDAALLAKAERIQLVQERDQIKAERDAKVEEIEKLRKEVREPEVIVREIPKYLPFHVESTPSTVIDGEMAAPQITIQGANLVGLWDFTQKCRECEVKLTSREEEVKNLEGQIKSLEKLKNRPWYKSPKLWFTVGVIGGAAAAGAAQ
jgi:hypothetical protein